MCLFININAITETKLQKFIGEHKGTAGHVALHYPGGGVLLASAGHWIGEA
jgi:hypothetical protein